MKLTKITLLALRGSQEAREAIRLVTGVNKATVWRWINDNDDNLTKAAVLKVIREELGLSDEEILDDPDSKVTIPS